MIGLLLCCAAALAYGGAYAVHAKRQKRPSALWLTLVLMAIVICIFAAAWRLSG